MSTSGGLKTISYTRGTSKVVKQQSQSQNRAGRRVVVNDSIIFGSVGKYVLVRAYNRYTANLCWLGRGDQAI